MRLLLDMNISPGWGGVLYGGTRFCGPGPIQGTSTAVRVISGSSQSGAVMGSRCVALSKEAKMIHDLTPEERKIEITAEESRPVTDERHKTIERIAERSKKTEAISLRSSRSDLELAKKRASEEGMPY